MKVLLLISTRGLFGAENVVLELLKQLPLYGLEPHIGILENSRRLYYPLEEEAKKNSLLVKIFPCKGKFDIRTVFEIRKFVRQNQITLIHSQGYKSNFFAFFATIFMNVKRITTCHTWYSVNTKMKFYEILDKILLRQFTKVVAVSDRLKDEIFKSGVPNNKIRVIDNGIDLSKFEKKESANYLKEEFNLAPKDRILGVISRLAPDKGHIYLLKAVRKILNIFPDIKCLIIGDGPLYGELKGWVENLKLDYAVTFTGLRKDIPQLLNLIDIFVLPSLKEGMPIALLEAMAARKSIVATKVGAIPKIIEDKKTGLLIRPRDADAIAKSVILLLKNEEMSRLLANNAFEKVKNEFSSPIMAQNYLELYKEALNNRRFN